MISVHTVDLTDPSTRTDLYAQCLKLRRDVFITNLGWNLKEHADCEIDQYDFPLSIHLAATVDGELAGCIRLLRTDWEYSGTTYMILDAHRGKIPNLPSDIMYEEVISNKVWEASRLAISLTIPTAKRNAVVNSLIAAARDYILKHDGEAMLGMMHPLFLRVFKRAGFPVREFGPISPQRDGPICILRWDFSELPKEQKPISPNLEIV